MLICVHISKYLEKKFFYSLSFFICPWVLFAGSISIQVDPYLVVNLIGQRINMEGYLDLSNQGDSTALDVVPELEIGAWKWVGEAQDLQPQGSYRWTVKSRAFLSDWNCVETHCRDALLPSVGKYPLLVRRNYQDLNGYAFSTVTVQELAVGFNGPWPLPLVGQWDVVSHGQYFTATLSLENTLSSDLEAVPMLYASNQVVIPGIRRITGRSVCDPMRRYL